MERRKGISERNIDDEIQYYIKKKKEENSALKKLLNALETSKKTNDIDDKTKRN
ncbi:MAG: hypothetical protein KQI35_10440 [Bacteroidetes bacterium]|nr:hypothetical protein [Bacteroidota bacterium]